MNPVFELIGLFFLLCILRVPIPYALGISSTVLIWQTDISLRQLVINMMRGLNLFPLLAIPFFILSGELMNRGDITERLILVSRAIVGRIRGSLAHITVVVSMFFAGISGSSTADAVGIGSVLIPAMIRNGYPARFSVAITAMSSTMGNIIPPSIYMIVYGAMGGVSIGALFLGGVIPGILIGLSQMGVAYYMARKHGYPTEPPMHWKERLRAFKKASLAIVIPVMMIGGIISGLFSATEASAALVAYCLVLSLFVYRSLTWKQLPGIFMEAGLASSPVLFTLANAAIFGWLVGYLRGPDLIAGKIESITTNPYAIVALLILFLLILGTFLSEIATIIIFIPIIQKLGELAHIHPIHLGVIVVMLLCLGLVTPPYGICLLIACGIGKVKVMDAFAECIMFIGIFLVIVALVVLFPSLTLWLPKLLMPKYV